MDKKYSNWIKVYIIDVLPGLAVGLYILGYLYNSFYYEVIGINISQHISLGEMLIDIINPLFFISVLSVFIIMFYSWFHYHASLPVLKEIKEEQMNKLSDNEEKQTGKPKFYRRNKKFIIGLLVATIIPLVLYISVNVIRDNCYYPGQTFLAAPILLSLTIFLFFAPISIIPTPHPQKMIMIVEAIVAYFIFAAILFGYCGYINGKYIRDYDIAAFEIKTNDGTIFDNNSYRYTNQVNDRVFLFEKNTKNNVIIGKENITYMKIRKLKLVRPKKKE